MTELKLNVSGVHRIPILKPGSVHGDLPWHNDILDILVLVP
jgi:hypothetical protein